MLHGVLEQRVERDPQLLGVGEERPRGEVAEAPPPRRHLREAHEDVLEEGVELDLGQGEEVRAVGLREQEQALDDALDPAELVERHVDLAVRRAAAPQHLEVAARDRHRRPELVRGVVQKPLLAREQRGSGLGLLLHLAKRGLPAPRVPDHREEHGRHERHLRQLARELRAHVDVPQDQRAGRDDHRAEHGQHRPDPPDAEAVQQRQADPDEVERDRLPRLPERHRDEVRGREETPPDLQPTKPRQGGTPRGGRSRSARRGRASAAAGERRPRRRSSRDRSGSPTPRRAGARG